MNWKLLNLQVVQRTQLKQTSNSKALLSRVYLVIQKVVWACLGIVLIHHPKRRVLSSEIINWSVNHSQVDELCKYVGRQKTYICKIIFLFKLLKYSYRVT